MDSGRYLVISVKLEREIAIFTISIYVIITRRRTIEKEKTTFKTAHKKLDRTRLNFML